MSALTYIQCTCVCVHACVCVCVYMYVYMCSGEGMWRQCICDTILFV